MGFILLQDDVLYRKVVTSTTGHYESGLWIDGEEVISYTPFFGEFEPFNKSQNSMILPTGVRSSDAILIYTNVTDLKTANDLKGRATNPDIIYLENPTLIFGNEQTDVTAIDAYEITDKEFWTANKGFSLLDDNYGYYLAVRLGKGE